MTAPDRLPMPSALTPEQRAAVETFESGPRRALFGPFVPLLRSPRLMTRLQLVGEHLRFESAIAPHLTELIILIVAARWRQDFEWGHHAPLARAAGLGDDVIAAVRDGADITGPADVRAVWRLVDELENTRTVGDSTFEAALDAVGDAGVVETIATVGYYTTLAMVMNAARTPVPDDYERLP